MPAGSDGPSVHIILGPVESFRLPPPPDWYGLLPDMTYVWRVRASDALTPAPQDDPSWSKWTTWWTFRTPKVINGAFPISPRDGALVATAPVLRWGDGDPRLFLFEFQFSADEHFDTNAATAVASVIHVALHGGMATPPNSYSLGSPLRDGTTYYWRVRPRIQGDGKPVAWSPTWSFTKVAQDNELVQNGDFESEGGWIDDCSCIISFNYAVAGGWHSGQRGAFLQPLDGKRSAMVLQEIRIPARAQRAILTYWFKLLGSDQGANDCFTLAIMEEAMVRHVKALCINKGAAFGWTQGMLDLSPYAGRIIRILFGMNTESYSMHKNYVLLDDVSVRLQ
ncbi:MAG: hypothetical protein HYY02_05190 [Chloroflexi bacterium]|nr:hypothetical protein [Chloroflexota bacterium]